MIRAFQWDLGRQMERLDFLLPWLPRYADWGYEELYLYLEDAFDFPSVPGVGRHRALSARQLTRLVNAATRCGIRVVPIVPLLGHASYLLKVPRLRRLAEMPGSAQLCPLHPDTLTLAERLLADIAPYGTAGIAHVGLDESFDLGRCPRCRAEVARRGLARHFSDHVHRLRDLARARGLRLGMWADMLYYVPAAIPHLPADVVAYDWYYYPFRRLPRVEFFNFAEVDLTGALRRAGLAVYGCPMNGPFIAEPLPTFSERLRNIVAWWDYAQRRQATGLLITSWSPNRTAIELNIAVDAAAASLWLNNGEREPRRMLAHGFRRMWEARGRRWVSLALAAEKFPQAGYFRWQTNQSWINVATLDSLAPWRREEAYFSALARQARGAPVALRACVEWRRYLAERDRFVREAARLVAQARRTGAAPAALRQEVARFARRVPVALRAGREMWARSRYPDDPNPNVAMLRRDAAQARALGRANLLGPTPVLGRWQLLVKVRNFAPAVQAVAVEQGGRTLHALYVLEFVAAAARPRTNFCRTLSVPVEWSGRGRLRLRLAVRGVGQVAVLSPVLTDGVRRLRPVQWRDRVLGRPAPRRGFRAVDWTADQAWVDVEFTSGTK